MIGPSNKDIVRDARALALRVPEARSLDLEPVTDRGVGIIVSPWRNDGAFVPHNLHRMMSRVGGFPPALARYFIAGYSKPGDVVLDPFCGKGTALLEAVALCRHAIGGDIAPDAVIVSRAKCIAVSIASIANYIEGLKIDRRCSLRFVPPNVALFYSRSTLTELMSVRRQILEDMKNRSRRDAATFAAAVMLGLLHGHSKLALSLPCNQAFAMSPNYVRRYVADHRLKKPDRDVRKCLLQRALELLPAPRVSTEAKIFEAPAEDCQAYVKKTVGKVQLIVTSPPYLNRQTYIKDSWLRMWFLGRNRAELAEKTLETGNVVAFVDGLKDAIGAMTRCLDVGGRLVLVCGRARVSVGGKDRPVRVGELCLYALDQLADKKTVTVEQVIVDKKLMVRGSYFAVHRGQVSSQNGQNHRRYGEDEILVLRKTKS